MLVTRPEPGAAETAQRLTTLGWEPVLAPALTLAPRPFALAGAQALLLTSRAAARALPPAGLPPGLPVLAVGEATAAEARRHGWRDVTAAAGDAAALAALAAERLDAARRAAAAGGRHRLRPGPGRGRCGKGASG